MGRVAVVQSNFSRGMRRASSRDLQMPSAVWTLKDFVPNRLSAAAGKRGGWSYAGNLFGGSPGRVRSIVDGPFNGGHYLLACDSSGNVYRTTNSPSSPPAAWAIDGTTANVGTLKQNPLFYLDTVVFPSKDGSAGLFKANENTVTAYTEIGTYKWKYLTNWRGRLVGAVNEVIGFGPPIAPSGTLTGNAWDDAGTYTVSQPPVGLFTMGGTVFFFMAGKIGRLRGTTPAGYGVTTDDIIIEEDFFPGIGCIDAYSIVDYKGDAIFANEDGIWQFDGGAPLDLTAVVGLKDYWRSTLASYTSNWRIAGGVIDELLLMSITDLSSHAEVATFVIDLYARSGALFTNCGFTCFAANRAGIPKTYAGVEGVAGRAAELSSFVSPAAGNSADANGTNVLPIMETPYYRFAHGPQRIHDVYLGFEVDKVNGADDVHIDVSYTTDPSPNASYSSAVTLKATDLSGAVDEGYHWQRVPIRRYAPGFALMIQQTTAGSARTDIVAIGAEADLIPEYRQA